MTYQEKVEQWRSATMKETKQFEAYKKNVEGMDGRTRHFDEMANEVMNLFEKTFTDITEEVMYDYGYDMAEPDDRNDRDELINVVRKKLYDGLKPCFEKEELKTKTRVDYKYKLGICKKDAIAKAIVEKFDELFEDAAESIISNQEAMYDITDEDRCDIIVMTRNKLRKAIGTATTAKEETKMVCDKDYDFMGLDCSITVDRVVHTYDGSPEYQFRGATNDIDELTKRIKNQPKREIVKIIPNRIWQNDGRHTTVEWHDGTKTTVCCEDPEKYTEWGGFCACVVKKLYGSATKAEFELETAKKTTAWPAKKKKMEREKLKAMKQMAARHQKELREQKIADKMEEMRITNEAGHRLAKEYSEKETAIAVEGGEQ